MNGKGGLCAKPLLNYGNPELGVYELQGNV